MWRIPSYFVWTQSDKPDLKCREFQPAKLFSVCARPPQSGRIISWIIAAICWHKTDWFFVFNAELLPQWRSRQRQTLVSRSQWSDSSVRPHTTWCVGRGLRKNKVEWIGKARIRKAEPLAAGQARNAYILTCPRLKGRTLESYGLSGEGDRNFCVHGTLRWGRWK